MMHGQTQIKKKINVFRDTIQLTVSGG